MLDSAHLQEEEAERHARRASRRGRAPREALYGALDALNAMGLFGRTAFYGQSLDLVPGVRATFYDAGQLPHNLPVFLDSPMAISATEIFRRHPECYDAEASALFKGGVIPEVHRQGVGGRLIRRGLEIISERGIAIALVLGDPAYYGRLGFSPALDAGLATPQPLPEKWRDAWMMLPLVEGVPDRLSPGTVRCATALDKPAFWTEDGAWPT